MKCDDVIVNVDRQGNGNGMWCLVLAWNDMGGVFERRDVMRSEHYVIGQGAPSAGVRACGVKHVV